MPKFRKKPVEVEAVQWQPDMKHPGVAYAQGDAQSGASPFVMTIHGQPVYLKAGDWILPEPVEGCFYPVKPEVFAATYDPVPAGEPIGAPVPGPSPEFMGARETKFHIELTALLNRNSRENGSNTPDFILAQFLGDCLKAFDVSVSLRSKWYGGS